MNIIECEQRGGQWFEARLGKPTASQFGEIVTPSGKEREGARPRRYALELLAERLTLEPTQHYMTAAMEAGIENEPRARAWYELETGRTVREVGFVLEDGGRWGCSPDGLMDARGLEIKCPQTAAFMEVAESGNLPEDHAAQVQASLWITGLPAWDYVCWTEQRGLRPVVIEVPPDAKLHSAFAEILPAFCDMLDEMEAKFRAAGHGYTPQPDNLPTWDEIIGKPTTV